MTVANRITLSRLGLSVIIFFLIAQETLFFNSLALFILIIATVSDYIDGKIAKSTNTVTKFGAIVDPFADKVLVMACFLAFASIKGLNIPHWGIFLIIVRELAVSTIRVLAALQNYVLKAEAAGKFKTLTQFVSIYMILIILVLKSLHPAPKILLEILSKTKNFPYYLTAISAIITIISGIMYVFNHYKMIKTSWEEKK